MGPASSESSQPRPSGWGCCVIGGGKVALDSDPWDLLKNRVSRPGATDKQTLRLFGESACPCPFLAIRRKTRTRKTEQKNRSVFLVRGTQVSRPRSEGIVEKPGRQECLPHSWSWKFLSLGGADTLVRGLASRCGGFSTRPRDRSHALDSVPPSLWRRKTPCDYLIRAPKFQYAPATPSATEAYP